MAEIGSAFLSILPSAKGFGSKLESEVGGEAKGAGKKIGTGFGKVFAVAAGAVAAVGVAKFLGGAIADARESQKISALTEQVIKTTGSAANVTAKQVQDLSGSIAAKTGIDDAAIQSASNLLLTFTNLRNEVGKGNDIFNQATQIATDLGVALGTEPKAAAIQLGKALNDPVKGVAALSRVGVTFTAGQKKVIESLVKTGDTAGAQKVILKELNKEFGGAAEAQATAADKAAFAFGELKESIGTALLPVVDRLATFFVKRAIPALQTFSDFVVGKVIPPVRRFVNELISNLEPAANRLVDAFQTYLAPALERVGKFMRDNPTFVKAFAVALGVLVVAIGAVTLATTAFSIALNTTGIPLLIIGIAALVAGLVVAYKRSAEFRSIVDQVGAGIKSFASFVKTNVVPVVVDLARTIGEKAKPVIKQLGETFRNDILPIIQKVVAKFREMQPTIQRVIGVVIRAYAAFLKFYVTVLSKVLPVVIRFVGFILSKAVPAIATYISIIGKIIGKIIEFGQKVAGAIKFVARFVSGLKKKFDEAVSFVEGIPSKITTALGDLSELLRSAGREIVQGLIDGIGDKIGDLQDKMGELGGKIKGFLPGSPVKEGPLRSWNHGNGVSGAGRKLIDGLAEGINARKKNAAKSMKKVVEALKVEFDNLKSAAKDLRSSIADAFRPDLLSGNLANFFSVGQQAKGNLRAVIAAFKKLKSFGLNAGFLSDLYASGNTGLILELAGDRATARNAQTLFNQTNALSNQLGAQVSKNEFGPQLEKVGDRLEHAIRELNHSIKKQPKENGREIGRVINSAATRGRRDARV